MKPCTNQLRLKAATTDASESMNPLVFNTDGIGLFLIFLMAHVELLYFWKLKQACSNLFLIATFEAKQMESSHVLHLLRCLGQLYESHISMVKSMNHPHFFHGWLTLVPCKQALFSVVKSIMFQLFSPPFSWQIP